MRIAKRGLPKARVGRASTPLKEREYIVSIAGPKGGGRSTVKAASASAAERLAIRARFPKSKMGTAPKGTDVIVTDTSKKKNSQTFYGY